MSPILQKLERGKAAAAPAQRHNLMDYFDPTKAVGRGPPQVSNCIFFFDLRSIFFQSSDLTPVPNAATGGQSQLKQCKQPESAAAATTTWKYWHA